jgi:hypothetical protein
VRRRGFQTNSRREQPAAKTMGTLMYIVTDVDRHGAMITEPRPFEISPAGDNSEDTEPVRMSLQARGAA